MGTLSQRQQAARQFAFRQWSEFIEDREDEHRRKIGHNDGEEEEDQRGPQPPCLWLGCQQHVDHFNGQSFQDEAKYQAFEEVGQPGR